METVWVQARSWLWPMRTAGKPSREAPETSRRPGSVRWLCQNRRAPCQGKCGLASSTERASPPVPRLPVARALLPSSPSLRAVRTAVLSPDAVAFRDAADGPDASAGGSPGAGGRAPVMPSIIVPEPDMVVTAWKWRYTSSGVMGRTHAFPRQAGPSAPDAAVAATNRL